uniref:Uncharacterized protein n=1 Tax=Panagrolaimus davidi TaxID=227884 RepID=A0A914P1F8_9BILA
MSERNKYKLSYLKARQAKADANRRAVPKKIKTEEKENIKGKVVVYGDTSVSIDPSITSSSAQTPIPYSENVIETVKQSIADITSINIDSNITPPVSSPTSTPFSTEAIQESSRSNVKRELEEIDDCMVVVEPPIKKPKTEYNETFAFEHPSTSILKEICKKLNLEYSHGAYQFWADIVFQNVVPASNNIQSHSFKSKNIFACLCQFFTGKTKSCFLFQHAINSALFDDLNASGIMPLKEIEKFCTSNIVFDEHVEFIAKYLSCRIGIFENGILRKFGKWQNKCFNFDSFIRGWSFFCCS